MSISPVVSTAAALLQKPAPVMETGVGTIARDVPMGGRPATAAPLYARLDVITVCMRDSIKSSCYFIKCRNSQRKGVNYMSRRPLNVRADIFEIVHELYLHFSEI